MSAEYRMERNPNPKGDDKQQALHPRLIPQGTLGTEDIAKFSQTISTISEADMKGALAVLAQFTAHQLREGYTVYIEGVGYLTPTLQSRPVMDTKELRSESVHFKNVAFRCDKELKRKLKSMPIYKSNTAKLKKYSLDERRERLIRYLDGEEYITSTYYAALNHCSKYSAQKDLEMFTKEGVVIKSGYRSSTHYRKKG